jgi:signal transduction histidine kinase
MVYGQKKALRLLLLPPWWRTWWAYLLYSLAFVACVGIFTWYRAHRLQLENLHLEEKVNQRTIELEQSIQERYELRKKIESQQALLNERLRISRELHDDIGSTWAVFPFTVKSLKKERKKKRIQMKCLQK